MTRSKKTDSDPSTLSHAVTLVSPSATRERNRVKKIRDTSGQTVLGLSKNVGRLGCVEKTLVGILNSVWTPYCRTWRVKVTEQGHLVLALVASAPTTKERESGYWLTPSATTISKRSKESMEKRKKYRESIGRKTVTPGNLAEQVQYGKPVTNMWRTPDAHCDRGASSKERMKMKLDKGMPISLNDQVKHPDLMWPTPSKGMWKQDVNDNGRYARDIKKKGFQVMLPAAVKLWPTPREFMYKDSTTDRGKSNLGEKVGGQLNPNWVEWLMGYQTGYTDLKL
tara:strand:+ start:29 stop:871 length:843 start_codon:yes stop_codon:yes gene_type:complete